ncbi:MAG TPA: hypothetical protein VKB17_01005 [Thermoleophilaceae bacterium]|nr:hypothetical protein [Thermoleophilaceae bacterium]
MEAATTTQQPAEEQSVSSFAKSLFLGEIHEELVFPFAMPSGEEQERVRELTARCATTPTRPTTRAASRRTPGSLTG